MIGFGTILRLLPIAYLGLWTPCNALFEEPRVESESVDHFLGLSDNQAPTIEDLLHSTVITPTAHHHRHHHHHHDEDYLHTLGAPSWPTYPNSENPPFQVVERNSQHHSSALNSEHPPFFAPSPPAEPFFQDGRGPSVDDPHEVPGRYYGIHPNGALQHSPSPSTHVQDSSTPLPLNPEEDKILEDMLAQLNDQLLAHYTSTGNVVENSPQLPSLGRGFGSHLHQAPLAIVESPDLINHSRQSFAEDFWHVPASDAELQSRKRIRTSSAHPTADAQFLICSTTPSSSNHPLPSFHTQPVEHINSDVHVSHKPFRTDTLVSESINEQHSKIAKRRKASLPGRDGGPSRTPILPLPNKAPVIPQVMKLKDILRFDREVFSAGKNQAQAGPHRAKALLDFIDSIKPPSDELYIPQSMLESDPNIWQKVVIIHPNQKKNSAHHHHHHLASNTRSTAMSWVERELAAKRVKKNWDSTSYRLLKKQSVEQVLSRQADWLQFWRDRAGITIPDDLQLSSSYGNDWHNLKNELTVFLFFVDMVATILREFHTGNHPAAGGTHHDTNTDILQKAVRIALEQSLKTHSMVDALHTSERVLPDMFKTPNIHLTWFWMTFLVSSMADGHPFKSVIYDQKNKNIPRKVKIFFNIIFFYSIEKLGHRVRSYYSNHRHKLVPSVPTI